MNEEIANFTNDWQSLLFDYVCSRNRLHSNMADYRHFLKLARAMQLVGQSANKAEPFEGQGSGRWK
jgi:hypothetical protein